MIADALVAARTAAREHGDYDALVQLIPFAGFLGVRLILADGQPRSHLPFRPGLIGNASLPALHGGVTASFMENAALLHLLLHGDEPRIPKSIDFSIDYLLPGLARDCYADCEVSRAGLRVAQTQIRCWQKSPQAPIAIARAHFLLTPPE
ncbi:MAG TPA: PaaI family thioesterase [Solimonas sp.]|nr:PaaI family thioesterase [Solimonas sp.]